jgi:hypothetical protein
MGCRRHDVIHALHYGDTAQLDGANRTSICSALRARASSGQVSANSQRQQHKMSAPMPAWQ